MAGERDAIRSDAQRLLASHLAHPTIGRPALQPAAITVQRDRPGSQGTHRRRNRPATPTAYRSQPSREPATHPTGRVSPTPGARHPTARRRPPQAPVMPDLFYACSSAGAAPCGPASPRRSSQRRSRKASSQVPGRDPASSFRHSSPRVPDSTGIGEYPLLSTLKALARPSWEAQQIVAFSRGGLAQSWWIAPRRSGVRVPLAPLFRSSCRCGGFVVWGIARDRR
jgi:hypothetical protein